MISFESKSTGRDALDEGLHRLIGLRQRRLAEFIDGKFRIRAVAAKRSVINMVENGIYPRSEILLGEDGFQSEDPTVARNARARC